MLLNPYYPKILSNYIFVMLQLDMNCPEILELNVVLIAIGKFCALAFTMQTSLLYETMDYLRMDGKLYASKVRNKALDDFDWLSQWLE